jgi:hypothetical protein
VAGRDLPAADAIATSPRDNIRGGPCVDDLGVVESLRAVRRPCPHRSRGTGRTTRPAAVIRSPPPPSRSAPL